MRHGYSLHPEHFLHETQKLMAMADNQMGFDPMAGSGTKGASSVKNGFRAILCDKNEDYIFLMENRLNVKRISI